VSESERALAAYRVGRQTFMGIDLLAAPGALVPRPETELLGRAALECLSSLGGTRAPKLRVVDMCCGSGNLACAIAAAIPAAQVWASDLTDGAVALARRNADHLHLSDRITVAQGDLFAPLAGLGLEGTVDMVVCNPPYISTGRLEKDRADLLLHEPREAFDGGPYGLTIHQRVLKDALSFLAPGAPLLFEIGAGQDRQIKVLFERTRAYDDVTLLDDEGGVPRVARGRKKAA
jgi:release factor glutamine methyltransferase